ncbi:MAG: LapA family protein, partial [Proteobacteria bacterium]|nr:LapA family protein [Pseudomonadota bacterium]
MIPPLAVVLALFAIANRGDITISVDPLPFTVELPLYLVVFGATAIGLIAGYLVMWISGYRTRRDFRRTRKRLAQIEGELHAQRAENAIAADRASVPTVERGRVAN